MFQVQHKVVLNDRKERKLARQLSQPGEKGRGGGGGGGEEEGEGRGVAVRCSLSAEGENGKEEEEGVRFTPRLRVFADVAGYSGVRWTISDTTALAHDCVRSVTKVFVCGSYPHWVFMTQRGALSLHPMFIDGPIASFTPFHNVNCPRGFLYFNSEVHVTEKTKPAHECYPLLPSSPHPPPSPTHRVSYVSASFPPTSRMILLGQ